MPPGHGQRRRVVLEVLPVALRVEWRLRATNGQSGKIITALSTVVPAGVRLGTQLYRTDSLADLRRKDAPAAEMVTMIAAIYARLEAEHIEISDGAA